MPDPIIMARGLVVRPGDSLIVAMPGVVGPVDANELRSKVLSRLPGLEDVLIISEAASLAAFRPRDLEVSSDAQ
jgi:hypothetical protein